MDYVYHYHATSFCNGDTIHSDGLITLTKKLTKEEQLVEIREHLIKSYNNITIQSLTFLHTTEDK